MDGDTAKIVRSDTGKQIKVRFAGIDTPEKKQAYGQAAKKYVKGLIAGKTVRVEPVTIDRYGRTVGYIWLNGKEINLKIVAAGYAWMYRQYSPKPKSRAAKYHNAEASAKVRKAGLWKDPNPMPPWEWRRAKRNSRKKSIAKSSSDVVVGKYHGNVESRIFHKPGCRYYDCKHCTEGFSSRAKAIRAGYKPCGMCKP
jgi:endonuclease YncB( thermonuclease family)